MGSSLCVRQSTWQRVDGTAILPSSGSVDIVAFPLSQPVTATLPLEPTTAEIVLGQQVYFLGYPFGLSTASPQGEVAFIKSGILSAMDTREPNAAVIYVDGHNNPGFSGGPVVFRRGNTNEFRVAGVIRGYKHEMVPVLKKEDLNDPAAKAFEDLYTRANTGIVVAYDIKHIVEAIRGYLGKEAERSPGHSDH